MSTRTFLLTQDDRLYQLPLRRFEEMLANSARHRFVQFAGQRIREAQVVVQFRNRRPRAIARTSFHILTFDANGCFDVAAYLRQEFSRAEVAISQVLAAALKDFQPGTAVIEAEAQFLARGGSWKPSQSLLRVIHEAAMGELECSRL